MKQPEDTKTLDLLGMNTRGRGRPRSDQAKSGAERQKARRERLRASGLGVLSVDVSLDILDALEKFVQFKDETKGQVVDRILRDRLLRKR